jgi:hypothetical protein
VAAAVVLAGSGFAVFGGLFVPEAITSKFAPALWISGGIILFILYDQILRLALIVFGRYLPKI